MNKKKTLVIVAVAAIAALAVWLLSGGKKEEKITPQFGIRNSS